MEELYYFVQVATLLSFSQVAQSMGVSQPAVSQKIKSLENFSDFYFGEILPIFN